VDDKQWQIIRPVIARLRASVMATAFGLLAGLGLFLDGVPISAPHVITGVEGFQREITAPSVAVAVDDS